MIPLIRPDLSFEEVAAGIREVLESGTLTRGPWVRRFEQAVAAYIGTRYAFATTSATTALHLALAAAGIRPGDEVLVSDFTYPATGNVVVHLGAVPVLVDSLPDSFVLDPGDLERKITPRTRAIIPVDPFGSPAPLLEVERISRDYGLALIEDAACALGASLAGRRCGAFGKGGCFSFHPRKSITTGEGGMITTDCEEFADRIGLLRNHGGRAGDAGFEFEAAGYNYRLSEVQAVLGVAQMERLEQILAARRAVAERYGGLLKSWGDVRLPRLVPGAVSVPQSYVVILPEGVDRDGVIRSMRSAGIETTIGTYALHAQPAYAGYGYRPGDLPNSWSHYRRALTLPLCHDLTLEEQTQIVAHLRSAVTSRLEG
jgi:perosamine synthetase